jgi:hypothetical protein
MRRLLGYAVAQLRGPLPTPSDSRNRATRRHGDVIKSISLPFFGFTYIRL